MIHLCVFLLSFSSLSFEVLLTRIFSISQWNHLSFMVISVALFGFAVSGTVLSLFTTGKKDRVVQLSMNTSLAVLILLYTITATASFVILNQIPLDYFRIPLEPVQAIYLLLAYLLLSLPFFISGFVISIAYAGFPEKTGIVYFASMAGSALGAIMPAPFLPFFGEGRLIVLAGLAPLVLTFFNISRRPENGRNVETFFPFSQKTLPAFSIAVFLFVVFLLSPAGDTLITVRPSFYKALSQTLQLPGAQIIETFNSLSGKIDRVNSQSLRFAPGLSLKFSGVLPKQDAVFTDGDKRFVLYNLRSLGDENFAGYTLSYSGYAVNAPAENVLVIQHGGGLGILCAIASRSKKINIVEPNPSVAQIIKSHYGLSVTNQNPRAFLARSKERFNVIHVENWGASLPGSAALNQEHLLTIEAFSEYLRHLNEDGIIIISRKLLLPPSDSLRLFATAYESLRILNKNTPETHIAILRNWDTYTMIVAENPIADAAPIESFARSKNFDLVYLPDLSEKKANRFNRFDKPYHFIEIKHLLSAYRSGLEKKYFSTYPLDIAPQTDRRPYPGRFLKWTRFDEIYKSTGSRFYALLLSGEIVVTVVLIEAVCISLLLLLLPRCFVSKGYKRPSLNGVFYFLLIGSGFMLVEIYFINKFMILFENPVISFTIVLAGILIFSGAGGFYSQRLGPKGLGLSLIVLSLVFTGLYFSLDTIVRWMLRLSALNRYLLTILLLIPPGFLMGLPFPFGMRSLLKNPYQRANAWAANGCASVLSSIIAAQISLSLGIQPVILCAIIAYSLAFLIVLKHQTAQSGYFV